jgi:hypothetical protein
MRIVLLPPDPGAQPGDLAMRACMVLRHSLILSARPGGIVNERAVVLVAPPDVLQAVSILKRSGIEAIATD